MPIVNSTPQKLSEKIDPGPAELVLQQGILRWQYSTMGNRDRLQSLIEYSGKKRQ